MSHDRSRLVSFSDHHLLPKAGDHLTRQGTPIGRNDLLIAAHALAAELLLVTANTRKFQRVPALRVENWSIEQKGQLRSVAPLRDSGRRKVFALTGTKRAGRKTCR